MSTISRQYDTRLGALDTGDLLRPLILTVLIVVADQITKLLIVRNVPLYYETGFSIDVIGNFFRIIHARNLGIAFSIGNGFPFWLRKGLFVAMPVVVLILLFFTIYRSREIGQGQRWCIAAVFGGGLGNIIDRVFRPLGVVDFLDVKFYGLFGMERWPTFNVADSSVVVGGIILVVSMLFTTKTYNE